MKVDPTTPDSSIAFTLDILGDKWTLLILRDMLFEGKSTFTEFKASAEKIASNILTSRLKTLDAEGFVIKTASAANKVKYRYSLTDKAIDLLPIFVELFFWAEKHTIGPHYSNPAYQRLKANDSATIAAYAKEIKKHRVAELGF